MDSMNFIKFFVVFFIIVALFLAVFAIISILKTRKSMIERAKKIDPTVTTYTDAYYVLQKDIAQNFGKNKDN